jgi:hypothetical protein
VARCTHDLAPLYAEPASEAGRFAYLRGGRDHWLTCRRCCRVGFVWRPGGRLRWVDEEGAAARRADAAAWEKEACGPQ